MMATFTKKHSILLRAVLVLLIAALGISNLNAQDYEPVFEGADCWFETPESVPVDCGYLVVLEDRSKPDGRTVRLATAIFRAPGGNPEPDPIIQLHGGPAGGALGFFEYGEWGAYAALTATNRDVVVFDQRGNGLSEPKLVCPEFTSAVLDNLDLVVDGEQISHSEAQQLELEAAETCEQRLSETFDLSMFTTQQSVLDINDLRVALGYEMVNLHGESYGTSLAQAFAREYPDTTRSIVLDAVEGPNDGFEIWPATVSDALNQTFDDCAADEACTAAFPNLREVWLDILERADEEPATVIAQDILTGEEYPVLVDRTNLGLWAWRVSYGHNNFSSIPQTIYQVGEGNYDALKPIFTGTILPVKALDWGSFYTINCNGQLPYSSREAFIASAENHLDIGAFFLDGTMLASYVFTLCDQWDSGTAPASSAEPFVTDIPTLVLGAMNDPATPRTSPHEVMEHLSNGFGPYIFPQMGHVVSLSDRECPVGITLAFIIDPTTAPDASCIDEMPIRFNIPGEGVALEPFTNEEIGFSTVVPTGWNELLPGVYARTSPATDPTIFGQMGFPTAARDAAVGEILTQLGADELPAEPVRSMDSEALSWSMYLMPGENVIMVALSESDTMTYMILLQGAADEFDGLAEQLLVPALMAFTPAQ